MSNPPPIQPPHPPHDHALNYGTPQPSRKNSAGMVLLRITLGAAAGFGACIVGLFLASVTRIEWMIFVPFLAALGVAIFVAIYFRRFGYVTGIILGPFILAGAVFMLLLMICGGMIFLHP